MRIRTVKPEFFLHEDLYDAEAEEGLPLRLAFLGLWCASDREGRFEWKPRRLKAQIFPYENVEFSRVLHALATRGFVVNYASGERQFGWIPGFTRHQFINHRESGSVLPPPPQDALNQDVDASRTREPRVTGMPGHARGEGKGKEGNKEGKGKEEDPSPTRRGTTGKPRLLDFMAEAFGLPANVPWSYHHEQTASTWNGSWTEELEHSFRVWLSISPADSPKDPVRFRRQTPGTLLENLADEVAKLEAFRKSEPDRWASAERALQAGGAAVSPKGWEAARDELFEECDQTLAWHELPPSIKNQILEKIEKGAGSDTAADEPETDSDDS